MGFELRNLHFTVQCSNPYAMEELSRKLMAVATRPMPMALCFLILVKLTHMYPKYIRNILIIKNWFPPCHWHLFPQATPKESHLLYGLQN